MMSISTLYTKLLPKCPDILVTKDQAFGHKLINATNVAAIGMISPVNLLVQCLCGPKIHTDLAGKPLTIVGNAINKLGKFSFAMIPLSSVKMFFSVVEKGGDADLFEHGDDIPNEFCKDTKWQDSPSAHAAWFCQTSS